MTEQDLWKKLLDRQPLLEKDVETKKELSPEGCLCVCLVAVLTVVHGLVCGPYIIASVYNWFLADFLALGKMNWHIAYGFVLLFSYLGMTSAKNSPKNKTTNDICNYFVGLSISMWGFYWLAWFVKDWNIWSP